MVHKCVEGNGYQRIENGILIVDTDCYCDCDDCDYRDNIELDVSFCPYCGENVQRIPDVTDHFDSCPCSNRNCVEKRKAKDRVEGIADYYVEV